MISSSKVYLAPKSFLLLAIFTYFFFPYTFYELGFSPHTLFVGLGFLSAFFNKETHFFLPKEKFFLLTLAIIFLIKFFLYKSTISPNLRALLISFSFFLLIRKYFFSINERYLIWLVSIIIILTIVLVFGQVLCCDFFYIYKNFSGPSSNIYAVGFGNWSNLSALMMVPFTFFIIHKSLRTNQIYYIFIAIASSACIYFTMSRSGFLAFAITLITHLALTKDKPFFCKALLIVFLGFILAYSMNSKISAFAPGGNESAGRWNLSDYSANTRIATFKVAIKAILTSPIIGIGDFEKFYEKNYIFMETHTNIDPRHAIDPHNAYMQFLSENGMLVTIIFFAYIIFLIRKIIFSQGPYQEILLSFFVGMMFFFLFHDGFHERIFWISLGVMSSHFFKKSKNQLVFKKNFKR